MADAAEKIVQQAVENATETLSGTKTPATPEGAAVAYGSLIIMAMLPIFFGALRSVKHQKDQKVSCFFLMHSELTSEPCKCVSWHICKIFLSLSCCLLFNDDLMSTWFFLRH